jgi:uncharacterized SAM-binding protein YcdF (DUF218 family)
MIAFALKKLVSRLLFPVPLVLIIGILGLVLLWQRKESAAGRVLVSLSFLLLLLFSISPIANALLAPLERYYPPLSVTSLPPGEVQVIVVLAGGGVTRDDLPVTAQLSSHCMARLVEGVRLAHALPEATLLLSGGLAVPLDAIDETRDNYRFAVLFGIEPERILIEGRSWDTAEQARYVADLVGDASLILVTSASHMPRSIALFRQAGLDPIPAPTDYYINSDWTQHVWSWLPSVSALRNSERAVYEYLGLVWGRLRGLL